MGAGRAGHRAKGGSGLKEKSLVFVMPKDAPPDGGAQLDGEFPVDPVGSSWGRVSGMQVKLHRWAAADPGRRFDDLFNLVCDPATLKIAFDRVAGNTGSRTAGVDGL